MSISEKSPGSMVIAVRLEKTLPDEILGLAIDPYGTHLLVTLASGINVVYSADKKKVVEFESLLTVAVCAMARERAGVSRRG